MLKEAPNLKIKKVLRNLWTNKICLLPKRRKKREEDILGKKIQKIWKKSHVKILGRKTKRKIEKSGKAGIDINKIKNGKNKLLFKIFNEFKLSSSLYKEYPQFSNIEKNLKNNWYSSLNELISEIRNTFSYIFFSANDSDKYNKIYNLCELFETIYKKYDNKLFLKESKNIHEVTNKTKRGLRQTEITKNSWNINIIISIIIYIIKINLILILMIPKAVKIHQIYPPKNTKQP